MPTTSPSLRNILRISEEIRDQQPLLNQPNDFSIRKATLEEQALINGKDSFPSRRSSFGVKALSNKDASKIVSEQWVKECLHNAAAETLFETLENLTPSCDFSEVEETESLKARFLRYHAEECALSEELLALEDEQLSSEILRKKSLYATKDFSLLLQEKEEECRKLEEEIQLLLHKLNSVPEAVLVANSEAVSDLDFFPDNNKIIALENSIAESSLRLEQTKLLYEETKKLCSPPLRPADFPDNKEVLFSVEQKTLLESIEKEVQEKLLLTNAEKKLKQKWREDTCSLLDENSELDFAKVLKILVESDGEMDWEILKSESKNCFSANCAVSLLYELVATRLLKIDRKKQPAKVSIVTFE